MELDWIEKMTKGKREKGLRKDGTEVRADCRERWREREGRLVCGIY